MPECYVNINMYLEVKLNILWSSVALLNLLWCKYLYNILKCFKNAFSQTLTDMKKLLQQR